jgi:hypothetical protein
MAENDLRTMLATGGGNATPPNPDLRQPANLSAPPDVSDSPAPDQATSALAGGGEEPMAVKIAKNKIIAGQVNNGSSRSWAENVVAGVDAALAGFGAGGKAPAGAGALYGVGAAARQAGEARQKQKEFQAEKDQRQQQIDIEKQRATAEQQNVTSEIDSRKQENARQQANSVRAASEHDKRMREMDDEHDERNYRLAHEDILFRQQEADRQDALEAVGAKPLSIAGQESPPFEHLGDLEQYARANSLAQNAHNNGYRTRPVLGGDGKWHLYEVPDTGPEWHSVNDSSGKATRIFTDPLGVLNYQEKVAQIKDMNARAAKSYADAKKSIGDLKDEGTVKKARQHLSELGGDYSKLMAGDKEALSGDAYKRYQFSFQAYQGAQKDLRADPDFSDVPIDEKTGDVDKSSQQYKDLAEKYHVTDAQEQVGVAYDNLRKLGLGYNKPGAGDNKPGNQKPHTVGNPGPFKVGDTITQNGVSYKILELGPDGKPTSAEPISAAK